MGRTAFSSSMAPWRSRLAPLSLLLLVLFSSQFPHANANAVFHVRRKFPRSGAAVLADLRAHDSRRHGRILSAADIVLGGDGSPIADGLYFAEICLGTPSKTYHVQVDTGSDILWVNCFNCKNCPTKTRLGFELELYNPKESSTANMVSCDDKFCASTYGERLEGCTAGTPCEYSLRYGDGSGTVGFFVRDNFVYNKVAGNLETVPRNASVVFGCGAHQTGELDDNDQAVDGIFGFGQASSSILSQLSSLGKVSKMFSHCLNTDNGGGGIFAIGKLVHPKVPTTPLVPNQPHYNVNLKGINVGGTPLRLRTDLFAATDKTGTIIDSGTTLTYLPDSANKILLEEILKSRQDLVFREAQGFLCFPYTANVDDNFPIVTFIFENSLTLKAYPHEYLFEMQPDFWCFGFQSSSSQDNDKDYFLLGDLILMNKLVFYDLENQEIGWVDYNCSSSIKVQDNRSNRVYVVGAHDLSNSTRLGRVKVMWLLYLIAMLLLVSR